MNTRRKKWVFWISIISAPFLVVLILGIIWIAVINSFHGHEHCIKMTGIAFQMYSDGHDGKFPYDTNGFGNALLLLVKCGCLGETNDPSGVAFITGPGDNGQVFREALNSTLL